MNLISIKTRVRQLGITLIVHVLLSGCGSLHRQNSTPSAIGLRFLNGRAHFKPDSAILEAEIKIALRSNIGTDIQIPADFCRTLRIKSLDPRVLDAEFPIVTLRDPIYLPEEMVTIHPSEVLLKVPIKCGELLCKVKPNKIKEFVLELQIDWRGQTSKKVRGKIRVEPNRGER